MDNKLLLVKGITLLYRESQFANALENSSALVRELITAIKVPEVNIGVDHERDILNALKSTALNMCDNPVTHQYEKTELLQRLKLNSGEDTELYEAIRSGIETELSEAQLKKACLNIKKSLQAQFRDQKIHEIISKASYKFKFEREKIINMNQFVSEVCAQLEPFQVDSNKKDPAMIGSVNAGNEQEMINVFTDIKQQAEGSNIYRTGFQGLNRALDGGFRPGEEWVFGALQHNYKTGMSLAVFMDVALYNMPVLKDPTKKAALVRISFEDQLSMNFQFMFQRLKGIEAKKFGRTITSKEMQLIIQSTSEQEMAAYVSSQLASNGFHCFFYHVNPSMWTYRDLCNLVLQIEAEGYEVQLVQTDYLLKLPTTGCDGTAAGEPLRNMYERVKNFMAARGIIFQTPHQLSTEAKMRIREGRTGFVQELPGGGFYAGCKQLDQVVDGELFQHIEKVNGKSYLTIQRGKHRKDQVKMTPIEHLYFVLEFDPVFGLLPDVDGPDTTRKKIGGGVVGSGEEVPFWDINDVLA